MTEFKRKNKTIGGMYIKLIKQTEEVQNKKRGRNGKQKEKNCLAQTGAHGATKQKRTGVNPGCLI
jgi:hypothetical protein